MTKEIIQFLDKKTIDFCVADIGRRIIDNNEHLFARPVVVLNGAIHFYSDLARFVKFHKEPIYVKLSTRDYMGRVKELHDWEIQVLNPKDDWSEEKNFLIIDEINDSGNTFNFIKSYLITNTETKTQEPIEVDECQLIKRYESMSHCSESYSGLIIDNEIWFTGYGMDYKDEASRHDNYISGVL